MARPKKSALPAQSGQVKDKKNTLPASKQAAIEIPDKKVSGEVQEEINLQVEDLKQPLSIDISDDDGGERINIGGVGNCDFPCDFIIENNTGSTLTVPFLSLSIPCGGSEIRTIQNEHKFKRLEKMNQQISALNGGHVKVSRV